VDVLSSGSTVGEGCGSRGDAGQAKPHLEHNPLSLLRTCHATPIRKLNDPDINTGSVKMGGFLLGIQRENLPSGPFSSYLVREQGVVSLSGETCGKFDARKMRHFHLARFGTFPRSR
jgi:hypothetical protein